jgi:hypothetical protein
MLCVAGRQSSQWLMDDLTKALICLFLLLMSLEARADDTVTISETTRMSFGTIAIPASGTQYLALSPSNSALTGTGDKLFGIPGRGAYRLVGSGTGLASITIDVMNVTSNSAALTLDNFNGIYNGNTMASLPSSPQSFPSASGTSLYLGARETVSAAMTAGALTPTFDIVVTIN